MDEVTQMDDMAERWLFDTTVGKITLVVAVLVRLLNLTDAPALDIRVKNGDTKS